MCHDKKRMSWWIDLEADGGSVSITGSFSPRLSHLYYKYGFSQYSLILQSRAEAALPLLLGKAT